ncbi:hypothetical protein L1987_88060 [Smallanthus sonchifolius]|nr:hypothetical protein L1987_88060 [Smallanthus sonchifolius]
MDVKLKVRIALGKQSSMASDSGFDSDSDDGSEAIDPRVRLMFFASEGDLEGIKKLLRFSVVVELLLEGGVEIDQLDSPYTDKITAEYSLIGGSGTDQIKCDLSPQGEPIRTNKHAKATEIFIDSKVVASVPWCLG